MAKPLRNFGVQISRRSFVPSCVGFCCHVMRHSWQCYIMLLYFDVCSNILCGYTLHQEPWHVTFYSTDADPSHFAFPKVSSVCFPVLALIPYIWPMVVSMCFPYFSPIFSLIFTNIFFPFFPNIPFPMLFPMFFPMLNQSFRASHPGRRKTGRGTGSGAAPFRRRLRCRRLLGAAPGHGLGGAGGAALSGGTARQGEGTARNEIWRLGNWAEFLEIWQITLWNMTEYNWKCVKYESVWRLIWWFLMCKKNMFGVFCVRWYRIMCMCISTL